MWLGGGQEGLSYLVLSPGFESGKVCSGEKRFLSWKLPTILSLKNLLGVQSRIGRETRSRLYLGISILTGKPLRGTGQFHRKALGILELHRVSERGDAKLWIKHFSEDVLSWARDRLWGEDEIISDVLNYRVVQVNCESTCVTSCFEVQSTFFFPTFLSQLESVLPAEYVLVCETKPDMLKKCNYWFWRLSSHKIINCVFHEEKIFPDTYR